ncbi:CYTH domain-containing protein [Arsukibacterium tuosuense]|uniref:CYTH domain-containing protein n=1 Tax=Arsukibacterium tuosuense TaxID=1323745 RepID=A0A285IWW3_9GAMM|nr:CYTH domain-containing protein [Arsukibacterium tuosuense]SNY52313.1 CYTH domain-containing protein [Arsukibacterium tuosuense]
MSIELELKFLVAAPDSYQLPALLTSFGAMTDNGQAALLNAYFDTSDNWFRRHGMGLRTRQKKGVFEQTLKLAGQQHGALQARPEFNVPAAGIVPELAAFPDEVWPADTDVATLQQQLTEIFRTDFIRHSWQLACDGTLLDVVYDSGEVLAGSKTEIIAELELELLSGSVNPLFSVAEQLISTVPLRTGWLSKAARGYLLADKQQLNMPVSEPQGLIANLQALQSTEALFYRRSTIASEQQENLPLLEHASHYLLLLSAELAALQYTEYSQQAIALARQLQQGVVVFEHPPYNQLLLALTVLLLQQSDMESGQGPL